MRYLMAGLALLVGTGATVAAPTLPSPRDGAWLDNGIQQYVRYNAHQVMSEKETTDATTVSSYICAVVDLEKSLVQRATLLSGAVEKATPRPQAVGGDESHRVDPHPVGRYEIRHPDSNL
jgi:hypothetical protein